MALRLIIGRAGSGKTHLCMHEIREELKISPKGPPLIYITPEQATFQAEYALLGSSDIRGSIRGQVLSFRRLAFKVMQEAGGDRRIYIDDVGKAMVARKVLERCRTSLKAAKISSRREGIVERVVEAYNELKSSRVSLEQLEAVTDSKALSPHLRQKIADLALIMEHIRTELAADYLDAEECLDLLAAGVSQSAFLKKGRIWLDGFHSYTNQELAVIRELLKHTAEVTVTFCLDRDYPPGELLNELNPFFPAARALILLKQEACLLNLPVVVQVLKNEPPYRFRESAPLAHLEKEFHSYPPVPFGDKEGGEFPRLRLVTAANRLAEVEGVAREIISLVRDKQLRWRDIAVMAGEIEAYRHLLKAVFADYEIPFFLDEKRDVLNHPLVEFLRSTLDVLSHNWPYEACFRCAKTEFLLPAGLKKEELKEWRERLCRLENYVLAFGIRGSGWFKQEDWPYQKADSLDDFGGGEASGKAEAFLREINDTRRQISAPLLKLKEKMKEAATIRDKTALLFQLLEDTAVYRRLEEWQAEAYAAGNAEKGREHLQVYRLVVAMMDQLVEIMGEEKVAFSYFTRLVEEGLDSLRLKLVPPSLDGVLVGTPRRTRPGAVKAVFILGLNEGVFPAAPKETGFFTEEEREDLINAGLELPPGAKRQMLDEQYLTYQVLTRSSAYLRVSTALADAEGKALMPAAVFSRLKRLFPLTIEEELLQEPKEEGGMAYIAHPRRALSHLAVKLNAWDRGERLASLWWDLYNWYASREEWHEEVKRVLAGVFYANNEERLTARTSRRLYGSALGVSVSRLEKYKACPFNHFISYGLRLQERPVYRLDYPGIGRFYHAALYRLFKAVAEKGLDWENLDIDSLEKIIETEVEKLMPLLQGEILLSSNRYRYLGNQLKETVKRAALVIREQFRGGCFKPVGLEVSFGAGEAAAGPVFRLENGTLVRLRGRIDRIDIARGSDGRYYLRVVDYKSGSTKLDPAEIYYGLSLQLLLYLGIALDMAAEQLGEEVLPAGALYFSIQSPLLKEKTPLSPEEAQKKLFKASRMEGRVLKDLEAARLMDKNLTGGSSAIVPLALTAGGFHKNSSLFELREFSMLGEFIEKSIREASRDIAAGEISIAPSSLKEKKACRFCPHKAVCQFDPKLAGNRYRFLRWDKDDVILRKIEAAVTRSEEEGD